MPKRRGHGEGTIFERKDGRWQGAITIGYTPNGHQKRLTVYARTQGEVRQKLDELKHQQALGTLPTEHLSTSTYLERWLEYKGATVKPRTFDDYAYTIENYVEPHIGWHKLHQLRPLHVQTMVQRVAESVSPDKGEQERCGEQLGLHWSDFAGARVWVRR